MKKILILIVPLLLFSLFGCASKNIKIENISDSESAANANDDIPDTPENVEMGDKFFVENFILHGATGEIYMSLDSAKVYATLSDAGLSVDDLFEDSLLDGMNYDAETGEFLNNRILVMVDFTVENVNAISRQYADEPENYDEYDFRVDDFGSCEEGPFIYSSKHGEVDYHYFGFHLEPGCTTQVTVGYLVDLRYVSLEDVTFNTAATKENGLIIDLNLGES